MKIAIIGAGAMGCLYATMLSGKNDITLLDVSEEVVKTVSASGVTVREADGREYAFPVKALKSGTCNEVFDLVILFVKDTVSDIALYSNRNLIGEGTLLLSLQNGMGNFEIIKKYGKEENVLLGTSKHNSVVLSPGVVYHSGGGVTQIGSPTKNEKAVDKIVKTFRESNVDCEEIKNVNRLLWTKLFVNMTVNPLTALLNSTIGKIESDGACRELVEMLISEAVAVAKADGEVFSEKELCDNIFSISAKLGNGSASMCQDLQNGRKTEIDFINGAVVRLGEKYGVPTPVHKAVSLLIKAKENNE